MITWRHWRKVIIIFGIDILLSIIILMSSCGGGSLFVGACELGKMFAIILTLLYSFNFIILSIVFFKYLAKKIYYFFIFIGAALMIFLEFFIFLLYIRYFS